MKSSFFGSNLRRQEIILYLVLLSAAISVSVLFAQEKLLSFLIGIIILAVVAWCRLNIKRWVYLVFVFMPISPVVNVVQLRMPVSSELDDFVVLIAILVFLLNFIVQPKILKRKTDSYLFLPLSLYVMACALSSVLGFYFHRDPMLVANALGHLFKWSSYVFIYFIVFQVFDQEKDMKKLLKVILVSFSIGAVITVYNYLKFSGQTSGLYRAAGLTEGLNVYAVVLAVILTFFYSLILSGKSKELFPRWMMLAFWSIILIALITTFSRTSWLALWACLIAISIFRKRRYVAVALITVAALNFLILRGPVEERIKGTFEQQSWSSLPVDLGGRELIWQKAIIRIGHNYFIGVGYSNFGQVLMGTTAHNQYLGILGESGLLGLAAFILFAYRLVKAQIYLARNHPLPFYRECARGILPGLIAMLVVSVAGEYFYSSTGILVLLSLYSASRVTFPKENPKLLPEPYPLGAKPVIYGYGQH